MNKKQRLLEIHALAESILDLALFGDDQQKQYQDRALIEIGEKLQDDLKYAFFQEALILATESENQSYFHRLLSLKSFWTKDERRAIKNFVKSIYA